MESMILRVLCGLASLCLLSVASAQPGGEAAAVLVYGATPAGLAAAMAAADDGQNVVLVEPSRRLGGLTTNGLSHTDFRTFPGLTGTFLDFVRRVETYYREQYGDDSPQVKASFGGTQGEPSVNLMVFEQMIAERPRLSVLKSHVLTAVQLQHAETVARDAQRASGSGSRGAKRISSLTFRRGDGRPVSIAATVFIDASYEGDLMAAAGVPFHIGRESRQTYGESLAPEQEDAQVQGYNFRLIMTTDPENRVMPAAPPGYDRQWFVGILPILAGGKVDRVFGFPSRCILKAHTPGLPNDKYDINDVSRGLVRLSLPGENQQWADGDAETRQQIFAAHRLWNEGLIYFLQNDPAVPDSSRSEARRWGWCRDEFRDNDHLPHQLYVREARRMIGAYVYTQTDTECATGDARAKWHPDAIAMGDYGPNCHGTGHRGGRFAGEHTGEFYHTVAPYQVPYGVLVPDPNQPAAVINLLVPTAASSSHVGFCALRFEPIWASLGQAAGHAAHLAVTMQIAVQEIPVPRLQSRLHQAGAATIYFSDVSAGDSDFQLAQWWGSQGGFHALATAADGPGKRGEQIVGQYFEPFTDHAAALDQRIDGPTFAAWQAVAVRLGYAASEIPPMNPPPTRRQWLTELRAAR